MLAGDGGGFRPVEVKTGLESGGQTEIVAGLSVGQRVVLSGQFLIDSEASLRGLEAKLNQQPGPAAAATHRTGATVQAIDGDTVTLDHPPIASLKWPQMVMDFRLPPQAQRPRGLASGEQVQIEFLMQDGDVPQITAIQRIAPAPKSGGAK
ncbi:MAG: copper-binding protein [Bradyrhizobium sp.]